MPTRATMTTTMKSCAVHHPAEPRGFTPIRTAVVGCGSRTIHNVLPKLIDYEEYELKAICDIRPILVDDANKSLSERFGVTAPGYSDYAEMLKKEDLDAVIVMVDPDKQIDMACRALEAGLHTMVEVPLTYSIEDCWKIVTTVERTGKIFMLMEQLRYAGYIRGWRNMIERGFLGKILFVEGQYFHYLPAMHYRDDEGNYYMTDQAEDFPQAKKTWRGSRPVIGYLPHELSPLLYAINDRVTRVVGMATRPQGYTHPELKMPDMQVALMHTEKDVVLRMAANFTTPSEEGYCHWHHIKGSEGFVESPRTKSDTFKMWLHGWEIADPVDLPWSLQRVHPPAGAVGSGHGDLDYYVFAYFADAVLYGRPLDINVYQAVETAAPAILAAKSIAEDNMPQDVPDFRPGPGRKPGEMP
jgi:predicted dehydrogenase